MVYFAQVNFAQLVFAQVGFSQYIRLLFTDKNVIQG